MWHLADSWRHAAVSLALLAVLTACSNAQRTAPATTTTPSAPPAATAAATPTPVPEQRTAKWIDLQVGDCLADPPPTDPGVVTVSLVDCAIPHAAEVYLRADLQVNDAVADVADRRCNAGLTQYTKQVGGPFSTTYLIDSNQDRTSADPLPSTVICLLQASNGGPLTGSARR